MVGTGTINDAEVKVPATHYLELAGTLTPTGTLIPVETIGFGADRYRGIEETRFKSLFPKLSARPSGVLHDPFAQSIYRAHCPS